MQTRHAVRGDASREVTQPLILIEIRELMPQDRKIEVEQLASGKAIEVAGFLAVVVVGKGHSRQMDASHA